MTISFVPPARAFCLWSIQITLGNKKCLNFLRIIPVSNCHGNPKPSFLGVMTHILGCKTFIFHGFGVQRWWIQRCFEFAPGSLGKFYLIWLPHIFKWVGLVQPQPRNESITSYQKIVRCCMYPTTQDIKSTIARRVPLEVLAIKPYQSNSLFDFQGQTNLFSCQKVCHTHRIHGTGICTYIYHKNQPFM